MELSSRRESSVQRRAAAAVNAAVAAECADDLMQRMLDEATGSRTHGDGPKALEPKANRSGGGMLDALGPVGPPLSFSPGELPMLLGEPKGAENLEVKQKVEKTPSVKRGVVPEQQSVNPPNEGAGSSTEPVRGNVNEHSPGDGTGKGKGCSSGSGRIEPRKHVAIEAHSLARDVSQGSNVRGFGVVQNVS